MRISNNLSLIQDICPSQFLEAYNCGVLQALKLRSNGARVVILRARHWMPKEIGLRDLQLGFIQMLEYATSEEIETQENGFIFVFDLRGFKFEHFRALSVTEVYRIVTVVLVIYLFYGERFICCEIV